MKVKATAIDIIDGYKYIVCVVENGGGVFRKLLPEGHLGQKLEKLINTEGMQLYLEFQHVSGELPKDIIRYAAIPPNNQYQQYSSY